MREGSRPIETAQPKSSTDTHIRLGPYLERIWKEINLHLEDLEVLGLVIILSTGCGGKKCCQPARYASDGEPTGIRHRAARCGRPRVADRDARARSRYVDRSEGHLTEALRHKDDAWTAKSAGALRSDLARIQETAGQRR